MPAAGSEEGRKGVAVECNQATRGSRRNVLERLVPIIGRLSHAGIPSLEHD